MIDDSKRCCVCDSTDIAYVDVLMIGWCEQHFHEIFLGEPREFADG